MYEIDDVGAFIDEISSIKEYIYANLENNNYYKRLEEFEMREEVTATTFLIAENDYKKKVFGDYKGNKHRIGDESLEKILYDYELCSSPKLYFENKIEDISRLKSPLKKMIEGLSEQKCRDTIKYFEKLPEISENILELEIAFVEAIVAYAKETAEGTEKYAKDIVANKRIRNDIYEKIFPEEEGYYVYHNILSMSRIGFLNEMYNLEPCIESMLEELSRKKLTKEVPYIVVDEDQSDGIEMIEKEINIGPILGDMRNQINKESKDAIIGLDFFDNYYNGKRAEEIYS